MAAACVCLCLSSPRQPPKTAENNNPSGQTAVFVRHAVRLRSDRAYRTEQGAALLVGSVLLAEVAAELRGGLRPRTLLLAVGAATPPGVAAARTLVAPRESLRRVAGVENGDGLDALAELDAPPLLSPTVAQAAAARRVLLLDGVQDPGNVGTLLRTALAFGVDAVALLPGCCDPFNGKALAAGRGAAFRLPLWRVGGGGEGWRRLEELGAAVGARWLAADPRGEGGGALRRASAAADAAGVPIWLVLGAEGPGLSAESRRLCSLVAVPGASGVESLNVAIAGACLMMVLRPEGAADEEEEAGR